MQDGTSAKPYDDSDKESILEYASKLKGMTLADVVTSEDSASEGEILIDGVHTKGKFGQLLERGYFMIENNNRAEPDFHKVGLELKSTPIVEKKERRKSAESTRSVKMKSKERLVLGIIDYYQALEKGFATFTDKNSEILIVFYHWEKNKPQTHLRIVKMVDWQPHGETLRIIREDWEVIQGFIDRGEAHLLSERHTKILSACTKGANKYTLRPQPHSDIFAKQRALSLKQSYMTEVFNNYPELFVKRKKQPSESLIKGDWAEGQSFNEFVIGHFGRFVGMTCWQIEQSLGIEVSDKAKNYYRLLTNHMLGIQSKGTVKEFEESGIKIKTIRLYLSGKPKEDMSFPAFKASELIHQDWEDSDFMSDIDREFLFVVFGFPTKDVKNANRKDLIFKGSFFWSVPDKDLDQMRAVWYDTQTKIREGHFDDFIRIKDDRLIHVRPHARDKNDLDDYMRIPKRCFWFNKKYVMGIVRDNLPKRRFKKGECLDDYL